MVESIKGSAKLLFRWFVGLNLDDPIWDPSVFTKKGERLLAGNIAQAFFERASAQTRQRGLLSGEHFTVDGILSEAWASLKSFKKKDADGRPPPADPGNPRVDFHGERRSNVIHVSTSDADARLVRKAKGHEAELAYQGHVLMENRHGLAVEAAQPGPAATASAPPRWRWWATGRRSAGSRSTPAKAMTRGTSSRPSGWSR